MKKNLAVLNLVLLFQLSLLGLSSHAELISVTKIPANGGYMIFELYDDAPLILECRNKNASGAIAKLEKGSTKMGYGSGCWTADINGYINLHIKSIDDGVLTVTKIHNSKFISQHKNKPAPNVRRLMQAEEELNEQCRGGSGDSPKTMIACEKRDKMLNQIIKLGWCWGSNEQSGNNKTWVNCTR